MMSLALSVGLLALGCSVGLVAGRLLHPHWQGQVVDTVQGGVGALLCLEAFALTGSLQGGTGELIVLAVLGAWVAVGTSHATAALMRCTGLTSGSDDA
jgi:hypothetical protein